MILHEEVWVWSSKKLNGQRHICWSKRPHPKIPVSTNVSLSTPWLPQLIFMSLEVRSRRHLFIITTTAPSAQTMSHCCSCDIIQYFFIKAYLKAYFRHIVFSGFFARILLVSLILDEHPMQTFLFCCVIYPWYWRFLRKKNPRVEKKKFIGDRIFMQRKIFPNFFVEIFSRFFAGFLSGKSLFHVPKVVMLSAFFCRQKSWCLANQWRQ